MMPVPGRGPLEAIRVLRACILSIDDAAARENTPLRWSHVLGNIEALYLTSCLSVHEYAGLMLYADEAVPGVAKAYLPLFQGLS